MGERHALSSDATELIFILAIIKTIGISWRSFRVQPCCCQKETRVLDADFAIAKTPM